MLLSAPRTKEERKNSQAPLNSYRPALFALPQRTEQRPLSIMVPSRPPDNFHMIYCSRSLGSAVASFPPCITIVFISHVALIHTPPGPPRNSRRRRNRALDLFSEPKRMPEGERSPTAPAAWSSRRVLVSLETSVTIRSCRCSLLFHERGHLALPPFVSSRSFSALSCCVGFIDCPTSARFGRMDHEALLVQFSVLALYVA